MTRDDAIVIETYKRLGELGIHALKACYLLHGAAAVALLAFLPHVLETFASTNLTENSA